MSETINIKIKGRRGEVELNVPGLKNMDAMIDKITILYFNLELPALTLTPTKEKECK